MELCIEIEPDKYAILVIQAKRIYNVDGKYNYPKISHKVNGKISNWLLEDYAKREKAIPLYMFYNYAPNFKNKNKNKKYYGCTLAFVIYKRTLLFKSFSI